ncbi:hypothetical protein [Agarivorans aestuarii]|uniref:hypothetical protein n=1 Tax=Agarivorans aestuarii TaxID=1563703 RepID=UPI001C7F1F1F|nr:hypothetical protein [Agarivorans aestuarii]
MNSDKLIKNIRRRTLVIRSMIASILLMLFVGVAVEADPLQSVGSPVSSRANL